MFSDSENKELAWKLIATLVGPEGNIAWNKRIGALPIYKAAERDPFYAEPKFKGWFEELADPNVVPTVDADLPARSSPSSPTRLRSRPASRLLLGQLHAGGAGRRNGPTT